MSDPAQLSLEDTLAGQPDEQGPESEDDELSAPPEPLGGPFPPTGEQAAAIEARDRDIFLEAGAGTGKTRVLVDRYCDAVDLDAVEPERILAFTFTEKAAAEMRRRVRVELMRRSRATDDPDRSARLRGAARAGEAAPITTIHGFCRRLLGAHPVAAGLDPSFRVLDAEEATRLAVHAFEEVLDELAAEDEDVALTAAGYRNKLSGLIRAAHDDYRNQGRAPELPPLQITAFEGDGPDATDPDALALADSSYRALRRLLDAFGERYAATKARRSGVDFDDLQLLSVELLRTGPTIARAQQERFDHLLVDEFQDTSPLQVSLVRLLCGPETRLFTVGDEFQSIYAFRGADLESFRAERERVRERLGASAVLPLSGSFRSDPEIVAAVNILGECLLEDFRRLRVGREPEPERPGPGGPAVDVLAVARKGWNEDGIEIKSSAVETAANRVAEARNLALHLRGLADEGVDPGSMVVLLRAFSHVDAYAEALERAGLDPYVVGGRGYWSAQQVEDALGLLACAANPLDDEPLFGALASPACGASPDALWILRRMAGRGRHVWPALEAHLLGGEPPDPNDPATDAERIEAWERGAEWAGRMPAADRERIERFAGLLVALRERAALLPLDELVETVLETFDYDLAALAMPGGNRRAANLLKLIRLAGEYESHEGRDLRGFLLYASDRAALSDREAEASVAAEDHPGVTVMTIHAAKGLEFDCVAVADLGRGQVNPGAPPDLRLSFERPGPESNGSGSEPADDEGDGERDWLGPRVGLRLARAGGRSLTLDGYTAIQDAAAEAESQESGRLAYVAASRARRRLILSGLFDPSDVEGGRDDPAPSHSVLSRLLPALGAGEEARQQVTIEPATARDDLEASFEPPTVGIHLLRAGPEAAKELNFELRPADPEPDPASGNEPPMLALSERGGSAARSLSYAALADYNRCGYRFLTERVLGLESERRAAGPSTQGGRGGPEESPRREDDEEPDATQAVDNGGPPRSASARFGFGRVVHDLLEASARDGWKAPAEDLVIATLGREGVAAERAEDASRLISAWLDSELLAELIAAGARFRPELPFRIELGAGTIMRGTIDLLAEVPGRPPVVVDYKTDARVPAEGEPLADSYLIQRALYAHAIAEATGASRVASAYVFLTEPDRTVRTDLDAAAIGAGRERIEGLIGGVRDRRFEVTESPHRALCHDCPARPRLCPHPKERTLGPPG